jgi:UDP-N-acetylmuramoyl-L-alanyl-D-glutamate--2,6-diaminopimelate ligase
MEAYLAAKLRLGTIGADGVEVVNLDDEAWAVLPPVPADHLRPAPRRTSAPAASYSTRGEAGSAFPAVRGEASLPLGDFNVANALAAMACALGLGRPLDEVVTRLDGSPQVPGRMERIAERPCIVLRDYAHTPDALERALAGLRPLTPGRLMVVFGCGGDRDRGKRPIMGRIAAELADVAVVTSDNPRTEDPGAIIDQIEQGMAGVPHLRVVDRLEAIHRALGEAREGDTLLLAGKGHETYQVLGTEKVPFDEREIVAKAVKGEE